MIQIRFAFVALTREREEEQGRASVSTGHRCVHWRCCLKLAPRRSGHQPSSVCACVPDPEGQIAQSGRHAMASRLIVLHLRRRTSRKQVSACNRSATRAASQRAGSVSESVRAHVADHVSLRESSTEYLLALQAEPILALIRTATAGGVIYTGKDNTNRHGTQKIESTRARREQVDGSWSALRLLD